MCCVKYWVAWLERNADSITPPDRHGGVSAFFALFTVHFPVRHARVQRDRHAHRAILLAALALLRRVMYALLMQRWCQQAYCICVLSADACVPWLCTLLLLVWSDAIRL